MSARRYTQITVSCHGQSSVERGFNINKQTMVDNLQEVSLTSLRIVYDEILVHGSFKAFTITKSLLLSCQAACRKYKNELEKKKAASNESEKNNKRKHLGEESLIIKKKKFEVEGLIKELNNDADKIVAQAGAINNIVQIKKFVVKANSSKVSVKEKREVIADLDKDYSADGGGTRN